MSSLVKESFLFYFIGIQRNNSSPEATASSSSVLIKVIFKQDTLKCSIWHVHIIFARYPSWIRCSKFQEDTLWLSQFQTVYLVASQKVNKSIFSRLCLPKIFLVVVLVSAAHMKNSFKSIRSYIFSIIEHSIALSNISSHCLSLGRKKLL